MRVITNFYVNFPSVFALIYVEKKTARNIKRNSTVDNTKQENSFGFQKQINEDIKYIIFGDIFYIFHLMKTSFGVLFLTLK